mmetsp:Transcript_10670/g.33760  ORF Transcript_10670/g.33760 Transcript_10670/m.33760 type:complete len:251 (+) Transcript_10670:176-928(+)
MQAIANHWLARPEHPQKWQGQSTRHLVDHPLALRRRLIISNIPGEGRTGHAIANHWMARPAHPQKWQGQSTRQRLDHHLALRRHLIISNIPGEGQTGHAIANHWMARPAHPQKWQGQSTSQMVDHPLALRRRLIISNIPERRKQDAFTGERSPGSRPAERRPEKQPQRSTIWRGDSGNASSRKRGARGERAGARTRGARARARLRPWHHPAGWAGRPATSRARLAVGHLAAAAPASHQRHAADDATPMPM